MNWGGNYIALCDLDDWDGMINWYLEYTTKSQMY